MSVARDNFSAATKRLLERRAGHRCSNPQCRRPTAGPGLEAERTINIGVAAHITAAAPGGPRYDSTLTSTQRSDGANGLWLCQTCGTLIDADAARFPVDLLHQWRTRATGHAFAALAANTSGAMGLPPLSFELDDDDRTYLARLALGADEHIDTVGRA